MYFVIATKNGLTQEAEKKGEKRSSDDFQMQMQKPK
jgi:hypothetical protein